MGMHPRLHSYIAMGQRGHEGGEVGQIQQRCTGRIGSHMPCTAAAFVVGINAEAGIGKFHIKRLHPHSSGIIAKHSVQLPEFKAATLAQGGSVEFHINGVGGDKAQACVKLNAVHIYV